MPSPSDIPPGNNAFNSINNSKANNTNDTNEAIDVTTRTPTPAPWVPLSRRHNSPSPSLSNQEQDEIFNRISSSMSHSSTLAARQEPIAAGLSTSPGRHILRRARIAGGRRSQSAARDVVELLVSGSDAGEDEDEDEDEDELLFLQTPSPNPNSNYSSSSRVGTTTTITGSITDMLLGTITAEEQAVVSRTWKEVLKSKGRGVTTTQHGNVEAVAEEGEGKNNGNEDGGSEGGAVLLWNKVTMQGEEEEEDEQGEEDSDSDGGAPLSGGSSENGSRLGNDRREEGGSDGRRLDGSNRQIDLAQFAAARHHQQFWHGHGLRANSDRKKADAAAQLERHRRRPDTPIPDAFCSGVETTGARSEADSEASPEFFSTTFLFQRAEARARARARARLRMLNRISPLDHPGRINSLQDGGQQARQPGRRSQQWNPDDASTSNADHFTSDRHRPRPYHPTEAPLTSNTTRSLHKPQASSTLTTNQIPKPPSPTTTTGDSITTTTTAGNPTTTPLSSSCSSQLGPFTVSPSKLALLASSQASLERLTTPKFHPAGVSRSRQNQEAHIQVNTAAWTNIDIDPKKKKTREEEEEDKEDWEMVDNPCDEYRVVYNPGKGNGYARNGGFGRRWEVEGVVDELPGGLEEEVCGGYNASGFVVNRNGNGEGSSSAVRGPQQHQHEHRNQTPRPMPPLHRDIARHDGTTPSTSSTTSQTQTQPHLATSRLRQLQQAESSISTSLSVSSYAPLSRPSVSSSSPYPSPFSGEAGVGAGERERNVDENGNGKGKDKGKDKGKGKAIDDQKRHHTSNERAVAAQAQGRVRNPLKGGRRQYQGQAPNSTSTDHQNQEMEKRRREDTSTRVNIRMGRRVQPPGRLEEGGREDTRAGTHTGSVAQQPSGRPGLDDSVDIDEGFADVRPGRVVGKRP